MQQFFFDGNKAEVPYLDQYFGYWLIREENFRSSLEHAKAFNIAAHVHAEQPAVQAASREPYAIANGNVAVIELSGKLMKHASSFGDATSTVQARRQIRAAVNNADISGILLHIDSPGGTVAGTQDLAAEVAAAAKQKRVVAYIEDLGASAAYWVASQANQIFTNATGLVGSIGTFAVVYDYSGHAGQLGIKVHVVRAGDFKGMGVEGTEITSEQLAEMQRIVDQLNSHFLKGVAAGRNLPIAQVRGLADGRVHVGTEAISLGLVDGVQSLDVTLSQLSKPQKGKSQMSDSQPVVTQPVAATIAELEAGCPGADNDFLVSQLKKSATLQQAQTAWMQTQASRIEAKNQELAALQAKQAEAEKKPTIKVGAPALESSVGGVESVSDNPISAWNTAVDAKTKQGKSRQQAVAEVVAENPDLHKQMLMAHNATNGRRHAVAGLAST